MFKAFFILLLLSFCGCIRAQKQENDNTNNVVQAKTELLETNKTHHLEEMQDNSTNFSTLSNTFDGGSFLKIRSLKTSRGYFIEISNSSYCSTHNVTINGKQYPIEIGISDSDLYFIPTSGKYQICGSFSCTDSSYCHDIQLK